MDISRSVLATVYHSIVPVAIPRMDTMIKAHRQRSLIPKLTERLCENGFHGVKRYHVAPKMELLKFRIDMHVLA